jgi:hypothetical protein
MSVTATPEQDSREQAPSCLGQYVSEQTGLAREIITLSRPDGSTFVVDCLAHTAKDGRVVAHLMASEPPENASIIVGMYLADDRKGHCSLLSTEDLARIRNASSRAGSATTVLKRSPLLDGDGYCYRILELSSAGSVPELRWARLRLHGDEDPPDPLTLRDLVGRLQDYEPAREADRRSARRLPPGHDLLHRHASQRA